MQLSETVGVGISVIGWGLRCWKQSLPEQLEL